MSANSVRNTVRRQIALQFLELRQPFRTVIPVGGGIVVQSSRASSSHIGLLCAGIALSLVPAQRVLAVSFGGDVAVTSDYIYRGFSESNHKAAVQLDLHASLASGTFAGVWISSLDRNHRPWAAVDLEEYIGQRFDLNSEWNTSVTVTNYSYQGGHQVYSYDYQQLSASVSYMDRWSLMVSAIPNAVRYWGEYMYGRYPAYDAEMSGQWTLFRGLSVTGGAGYYLFTGTNAAVNVRSSLGYAYGNVGLAYEWHSVRAEVGYFLTQKKGQVLFPYPIANDRVAGTLSWHF